MTRRGRYVTGTILVFMLGLFLMMWISVLLNLSGRDGLHFTSDDPAVGVVEITGIIYNARPIVRQIKRLRKNHDIRGLLIHVNSPGGGVAASQEIYDEVRKTRDSGIPVLATMGSVAASGGYYIACGADSIMANPGTVTGSIGVIIELSNAVGLFEKIGLETTTVQSGKFKDSGGPHRRLTVDDRAYFQELVDDMYDQFVTVVTNERPMNRDAVLAVADGRVFTGRQARESGLIDLIGNYEDALTLIKQMAGLDDDAPVIRGRRRDLGLLGLLEDATGQITGYINPSPFFAYLMW